VLTQAGLPHIAYDVRGSDGKATSVKYATCSDVLCSTNSTTVIKNQQASYYLTSVVLDSNNFARIVYSNDVAVGYVQCLNSSCTSSKVSTPVSGASYPATIAMAQDGLPRILLSTNNAHDFSVVRLIADDGRASVTGQTFGSWFKSIGEIFASRVTTQLLDVTGSSTIAGVLHVDSKIETSILDITNTASSSGVVTGSINMGGVPFIHNYSSGTDCSGIKSSVFIGINAGNQTMSRASGAWNCWYANYNVGIGGGVLSNITTGFGNVAVMAMAANTTGWENAAFGTAALTDNTTGYHNVAVGDRSLWKSKTGYNNVGVGVQAGANIGVSATSSNNTFLGYYAAQTQISGDNNIALGSNTSLASTTGSNQLTVGSFLYATNINSLVNSYLGIGTTSPSAKLDIWGNLNVGTSSVPTLFADTSLSRVSIATTSSLYTLTVGNTSVSGVVARFENSTGYCDINPTTTSLTCTSDVNLKKNIVTLDASTTLANLTQLNAVTYNWKSEDNASSTHAGFIAQEVQPLFPDLVATDANGTLSVSYGGFIPYIIQSIKSIVATITNFKESFTTGTMNAKKVCIAKADGTDVCVTGDDLMVFLQQRANSQSTPQITPPVVVPEISISTTTNEIATTTVNEIATTTTDTLITTEPIISDPETAQVDTSSTSEIIITP
jgi:hypothetical protein